MNEQRNWWIVKIISFLGLLYLVLTILGFYNPPKKKLDSTDAAIFTAILLFNSGLIERLSQIQLKSDGGWTVQLSSIKGNIEANRGANQAQSAALSFLGYQLYCYGKKNEAKQFFSILVSDGELKLLESLADALKNQKTYFYQKSQANEKKLRELRALDLINIKPGYEIGLLVNGEDLTKYFTITYLGQICLQLGPSKIEYPNNELETAFREFYTTNTANNSQAEESDADITAEVDTEDSSSQLQGSSLNR